MIKKFQDDEELGRHEIVEIKEIKRRLGFLIEGYKSEYLHWEVLSMMQKIIVVYFVIFLGPVSIGIQCLLTVLVIEIGIRLMFNIKPYRK